MRKNITSIKFIVFAVLSGIFFALLLSSLVVYNERRRLVDEVMDSYGNNRGFFYLTEKYSKIGTVRFLDTACSGSVHIINVNGKTSLPEDERITFEANQGVDFFIPGVNFVSCSGSQKVLKSGSPDYSIQIKLRAVNSTWESESYYFPNDDIPLNNDLAFEYDIYAKFPSNSFPHFGFVSLGELNNVKMIEYPTSIDEKHFSFFYF